MPPAFVLHLHLSINISLFAIGLLVGVTFDHIVDSFGNFVKEYCVGKTPVLLRDAALDGESGTHSD
jgi:hypothetical protein